MDFEDSPGEAAFRAGVRAWLAANAPPKGAGSAPEPVDESERLRRARDWQARKAAAGYAAITWPQAYGGRDGTRMQEVIYRQEEARFEVPTGVFDIGLGMCIPTLLAHGTEEQRRRHAGPALRGEEIWCQLFSEPQAGSDLAGVRTRAVRAGDGWLMNGQKVWTSGARFSDFGLLLARSHPHRPKHDGLTMFILDMRASGVTVRPIRQLDGRAEFNEVFLDDVPVADADRIGLPGEGWKVAVTTLMHERLSVGGGLGLLDQAAVLGLLRALHPAPAEGGESRLQDRVCDWYLESRGLQLMNAQALTALSRGATPGPEQSIAKLIAARQGQQVGAQLMDMLGEAGLLAAAGPDDPWASVERAWTWGTAMRVAGGTDEILRTMLAERVLGLPPEPRPDKVGPFHG